MATLNVGGGRRSAAPVFSSAPQPGTSVLNYDRSISDMLDDPAGFDLSPDAAGPQLNLDAQAHVNYQAPQEQLGPTFSGSGNSAELDWARDLSQGLRGASMGIGLYGQATGDTSYNELGKGLGTSGLYTSALYNLANARDASGVAKSVAPTVVKELGMSAPYAGMVLGAINDGPRGAVAGTVTGALSVAFPAVGIVNAISGALGGPTIGSLITKFIGGDKPPPTPEQIEEGIRSFFGGLNEEAGIGLDGSPTGFSGDLFNPNSNPGS